MCFRPPSAVKKEKRCPKCGSSNLPTAEVCKDCGTVLPKVLPPGMRAPAPGAPAGGAVPPPQPPEPPKAPPAAPKAPLAPPKKPEE
jgi:hypothetical protein